MAINYAYAYAEVDNVTGMCVGMMDTTDSTLDGTSGGGTTYVLVPEYSDEYFLKYYNFDTKKWYYDSEMTQEFVI